MDNRYIISHIPNCNECVWDLNTEEEINVSDKPHDFSDAIKSYLPKSTSALFVNNTKINIDTKTGAISIFKKTITTPFSVFFFHGVRDIIVDNYRNKLVAVFSDGRVEFYNIENLPLGPFIATAQREIISEDLPAGLATARMPCCGQLISTPSTIADRIEHWTHEGGESGYIDPELLLDCPNCATPLRMNPFFVNIQANN